MANLYDTIRQNYGQIGAQQAPMTDQTSLTQKLLRAKRGREVGDSEPAISNLQEQVAIGQTQAQLQQMQPALQLQQEQLGLQQQRQQESAQQAQAELAQSSQFDNLQTKAKTASLLSELSRDRGALDLEKDQARLEQASFLLGMQNKKYVSDLQNYAQRNRLDNEVAFRQEMDKTAFGNNMDLIKQKIGYDNILAANDREYKKAMSQLSIEDAEKIAEGEMAHQENVAAIKEQAIREGARQDAINASTQAKWAGISSILSGGIGAAGMGMGAYQKSQSEQAAAEGVRNDYSTSSAGEYAGLKQGDVGTLRSSERY